MEVAGHRHAARRPPRGPCSPSEGPPPRWGLEMGTCLSPQDGRPQRAASCGRPQECHQALQKKPDHSRGCPLPAPPLGALCPRPAPRLLPTAVGDHSPPAAHAHPQVRVAPGLVPPVRGQDRAVKSVLLMGRKKVSAPPAPQEASRGLPAHPPRPRARLRGPDSAGATQRSEWAPCLPEQTRPP